jgi:outer membrane protein
MKKALLTLALTAIVSTMNAQQALTFADCLEKTMANNLQLKSAAFDEKIAVTQHRASYGQYLPSIIADGENRNSWGKEIDPDTNTYTREDLRNYEGTLNAYFNLFSGFSAHNTVKLARQEKEITRARIEQIRNEVTIDLAQRFITILYLQEIILANEEQIKSSAKQEEIAELKFNAGVISESELFKIKAQKVSEELNLLTNQNRLTDNMVQLKQLMDVPLETEILLLKPNLDLNENVMADQNIYELTKKAVDIHPAFKASLLEQKKARTELALARAPWLPVLSLRLMYRSNYDPTLEDVVPFHTQIDENTSKQIRFYLTVPIFSRFENYAKVQTNKLLYNQSKITTKLEENRLSKEVLMAINNAKTSLKKNESSTMAFDFSQKSYDADVLKFEVGKININDLNMTKIIYNTNQAELIQSKYELLFNNALIKFYSGEEFTL